MPKSIEKPHKPDIYAEVTAGIISDLEKGSLPWVQPWSSHSRNPGELPRNAITDRPYSGINILILWCQAIRNGFGRSKWLTFAQALGAGGSVRKGERGTAVVLAKPFTPERERDRAREQGDEPGAVMFLKRFTVFNIEQCDGCDTSATVDQRSESSVLPNAERLIEATGADFRIGGDSGFYSPSQDFIQVPKPESYHDPINWHRTAFHELGHWTGHSSRLDRQFCLNRNSADYAHEELIAELAGAFLCATLGIQPTVRHADYIADWLGLLRNDNRAVFRAASAASKAADYVLQFRECEDQGCDTDERTLLELA